jgi:hypothetical protein
MKTLQQYLDDPEFPKDMLEQHLAHMRKQLAEQGPNTRQVVQAFEGQVAVQVCDTQLDAISIVSITHMIRALCERIAFLEKELGIERAEE